jgi:hippurate hydrolase
MNEQWRAEAHGLIEKISTEVVHSMGAELDMHIDRGYPAVINNEELNASAKKATEEFLGKENISETELRMGAEDFGYYAQQIPACFYRVHTPTFNIDERAIEVGMGLMAWLGTRL